MTTEAPLKTYRPLSTENNFTKTVGKFLTAGTLVVTCGVSNIPSNLNTQALKTVHGMIDIAFEYSNGKEVDVFPFPNKKTFHQTPPTGIGYNESNNKVLDITLWTGASKEAINLNQNPPIYRYNTTMESRLVNGGSYEFLPIPFEDEEDEPIDFVLNNNDIYQFQGTIKSKIRTMGELQFSPIDGES